MSTYRNKNTYAVDIYQSIDFDGGKLRYSIGKVKPDTAIEAMPHSDPRFLVVASGGYAYAAELTLASSSPPPDPTPNPSGKNVVEVFVDGVSVFRQELP